MKTNIIQFPITEEPIKEEAAPLYWNIYAVVDDDTFFPYQVEVGNSALEAEELRQTLWNIIQGDPTFDMCNGYTYGDIKFLTAQGFPEEEK